MMECTEECTDIVRRSVSQLRKRVSCITVVCFKMFALSGFVCAQPAFEIVHVFGDAPDANDPTGTLIQGSDGTFYGTTGLGGDAGMGTVFRMTADGTVTVLHSFIGGPEDGAIPSAGLTLANDGNFYGTTIATSVDSEGDPVGPGEVFTITPDGDFRVLYAFQGRDGSRPVGTLIQAADGQLYGTTPFGGAQGRGTIFRMTLDGALTILHEFNTSDGAFPHAGLIQANDGNLYGSTEQGGASGAGVLFRMASDGSFSVLYEFTGPGDGSEPEGALLQAADGNLYGTTHLGGAGGGTVFQLTLDGAFQVMHSFGQAPDAGSPFAALIQASDQNFYGTTVGGGPSYRGTVFQMTPDGTVTILHEFDGYDDGTNPFAGLLQAADGNLYGVSGGSPVGPTQAFRNGVAFRFPLP